MTHFSGLPSYGSYVPAGAPAEKPDRPFVPGTHGLATASFVLGICGAIPLANLLAILFGIIALVQLKQRTQKGKGLAVAGLGLAGTWLLIFVVAVAVAIATSSDGRNSAGEVVSPGTVAHGQLRPGDCVNGLREGVMVRSLTAVPCGDLHEGEIFAVFDLPSGAFPGESVVDDRSADGCFDRLDAYAPDAGADDDIEIFFFPPGAPAWSRDRTVLCLAVHPPRAGSIRT